MEFDSPVAFSIRQAAAASSLSIRTLSEAIRHGELRAYRKGRRVIVMRDDLETYLRSQMALRTGTL